MNEYQDHDPRDLPEMRVSASGPAVPGGWPSSFAAELLHVLEAGRGAVGAMPHLSEDDEDGADGDVTVIAAVVAVCRGETQTAALRAAATYAETAKNQGLEICSTALHQVPDGTGEWDLVLVLAAPDSDVRPL
ncbi:hypothetical protein [Streptomyces acidiscabies]|uniref:hypothetical protein n=1 Tax=Streptomyces acidiscabies TaxID=42234 RepID=UPI0038F78896